MLTQFSNMFDLLKAENIKVALENASQTEKQQNPTRGQHPIRGDVRQSISSVMFSYNTNVARTRKRSNADDGSL